MQRRPGRIQGGVPVGPGDEEGRGGVAAHLREADEAFLRDVEGAAQAPVARLPEVGGAVLGRRRVAADLILLAAALLGLNAGGQASSVSVPRRGRVVATSASIAPSRRWSAQVHFQSAPPRSDSTDRYTPVRARPSSPHRTPPWATGRPRIRHRACVAEPAHFTPSGIPPASSPCGSPAGAGCFPLSSSRDA